MRTRLPVVLFIAVAASAARGQESREYSVFSSTEIVRLAQARDLKAIKELGFRGDRSMIPFLKQLVSEEIPTIPEELKSMPGTEGRMRRGGIHQRMDRFIRARKIGKIALARLGDKDSIDEFVRGLSSKDEQEVSASIISLGNAGNKGTVKYLIPYLDDDREEEMTRPPHPATMPHKDSALASLTMILPDVAADIEKENSQTHVIRLELWKRWWKENKGIFEK